MEKGKIILLNGVSSSGKSTLAAKLLEQLPNYFVLGFDDIVALFLKMKNNQKELSTWSMIHHKNYDVHIVTFILHRLVKSISEYSFNIILDTVLDAQEDYNDFMQVLKSEDVLLVGVHCPLAELERREHERGDRKAGMAKEQLEFVHKNMEYDVEVDTYHNTLEECAQQIINRLTTTNTL
jgi:chloramphenicol 3-O phosphotransferase